MSGQQRRKRQRDSQTDNDAHVLSHGLCPSHTACQRVTVCERVRAYAPESTLITPFVWVMIKTMRKGGEHQREKSIPVSVLFENDTYCSSSSLFFVWRGAGERGRIISVRFGEQMRWGGL